MTASLRSRIAVYAVGTALGWLWALRRLRHSWFYYDEWSMIGRTLHYDPIEGMTTQFNGHLWVFQDVIYRIQVRALGLDDRWFLVGLFLLSLASLHGVLALTLERVGIHPVPAVMLGGSLTYLGSAAQNFVFTVQVSPTFAAAAAYAPAVLVLGRGPARMRLIGVGALALASVLFDSAFGLVGVCFAAVLLVREWGWRALLALAPAVTVLMLWYGWADLGPEIYPSDLVQQATFAPRLLVRSAGALFGGGPLVGVVLLALGALLLVVVAVRVPVDRTRWSLSLAGLAAAAVVVGGIARNRAGIPDIQWREFNRYFQNVGLPLALAAIPLLAALLDHVRPPREDASTFTGLALGGVAVLVFVLGIPQERDYGADFIAWNDQVRRGVGTAVVVVDAGCPDGTELDLSARPLGGLNPQISTRFVLELVRRGLLEPDPDAPLDDEVVSRMCTPL